MILISVLRTDRYWFCNILLSLSSSSNRLIKCNLPNVRIANVILIEVESRIYTFQLKVKITNNNVLRNKL